MLGLHSTQAITWDGNGSPDQGGDWSVGQNWDADTSPIAGESAVLGTVSSGTRVITYDPAAEGALGTLILNQSMAGATNELRLMKNFSVANDITLGSVAGTVRITVGSIVGTTFSLTPSGGLTLHPGGELLLSAIGNGGSGYNFGNLAGSDVTTRIEGGALKVGQITGTSTGTSAQTSIQGNLAMSAGALVIENSPGIPDRRLQVGGDVDFTGGVVFSTRAGMGGSLIMSGSSNHFHPAAFDPELTLQLDRLSDQTLATQVSLGPLTLRGSGVKTVTGTAQGGFVGAITFFDGDNATPSSATTLKLGADLTLTNAAARPSFSTSSQVLQSGRIDAGIDTNGFTLDLSTGGEWRPNEGQSSALNAVWSLSGTGTIKAAFFDFTSTDVTVNVAAGVTLRAVGGGGTSNDLGDLGGDPGMVDPASTFLYTGAAAPGFPAILTSNRAIGNLEIASGALRFQGSGETKGSTTIRNGELGLSYSLGVSSMLSDSAVLRMGMGTLKLTGPAIEEIVGSTHLEGAASIIQPSGSTVLNMGEITVNPGGSLDLSAPAIAKTTNANDAFGILGTWASINGSDWATNDAGNIVAFTHYTDIPRTDSGSQIIADAATSNVRLVEGSGTAGNITLGSSTTTLHTLNQSNSGGSSAATIDLPDQALAVDSILSGKNAGALTIGTVPNSGTLSSATAGGSLEIINFGLSPLTVNSVIADHGTASSLAIGGTGTTTLNGNNSFTGKTFLDNGKLVLTHESGLGPAPASFTADQLTLNGGTLMNVSEFSLGEPNRGIKLTQLGGTFEASVSSLVPFTVGNVISGPGRLTKTGAGMLTLNGNNTYQGGTVLPSNGAISLGHSNALGTGELTLLGSRNTVYLSGDITVINDIVVGGDSPYDKISNLSGSNTLSGKMILEGSSAAFLLLANEAEAGSTFTVDGTFNRVGLSGIISLRGNSDSGESRFGRFNPSVNASRVLFELAGDTDWTIGSTGNDWNYTLLYYGTGSLILGVDDALDTGGQVVWGTTVANNLDLNGHNQTVAGIDTGGRVGSGGVTNRGNTDSILTLSGLTADRVFAGTIRDGVTNRVHLVMSSPGRIQTLAGTHTSTGDTTINGGTLALGPATALADSSTIRINGATSILKLGEGVTDVVNVLVIDGVLKAPGTWGSTASTATFKDDIHFSGTGVLQVVPYTAWANSFGLQNPWSGGDAAFNGDPTADPDNDGVSNFQEFAFGLVPVSGSSLNPIALPLDQTTGIFNYTRRRNSLTGLRYSYVHSTSLVGDWIPFTPVSENSDQGDPVETVSVMVPGILLEEPKLFVRVLAW